MQDLRKGGGRVSVKEAAAILGMDCQTVRVLLQNQLVPWGFAFKKPGSRHYSYLIYRKPFEDLTGYGGRENDR